MVKFIFFFLLLPLDLHALRSPAVEAEGED